MTETDHPIAVHYDHDDLEAAILAAAEQMGLDPNALTPDDLSAVDEFHLGGREATLALAEFADPKPGDHVLDIGAGIGGPARLLAHRYGCRVTGIDVTPEFCRTAELLSTRVGLGDSVTVEVGDATAMAYPDGVFDLAWTQHVAMNIADKDALYAETFRVLKPGGRFALYDIIAGPAGDPRYPVPWASQPEISHLVERDAVRGHLESAGFRIEHWEDPTPWALDWLRTTRAKISEAGGPPPLSLRAVMGPDFAVKLENLAHNLEEGRVALLRAIAARPN
jgi:MPBQ/MSBQ methyltransferase